MKTFVAVALILWLDVLVFAIDKQEISDAMGECHEETKVDKDLAKQAIEQGIVAEDPKLKADIECFFKKLGILKDGEVDKDKLKEFLTVVAMDKDEAQIQKLVDECANKQGATPQDKIVEVYKCGFKQG